MPTLLREELYERVWNDPVRTVASEFGVSDVWLKKICAQARVPVPDRGYWTKLRAGKAVVRAKLPPRDPGQSLSVTIGAQEQNRWSPKDPERELALPVPVKPVFPEPIEAVEARVRKLVGKVTQQRDLKAAHGAIRKLLDDDEKRGDKSGSYSSRFYWSQPLFDSPFERRRFRILSALFSALVKTGQKPLIQGDEARTLGVYVGSSWVSFRLDHPNAKPDRNGVVQPRQGKADTLKLAIEGADLSWVDEPGAPLESLLTEITVQLVLAGETQLRERAHRSFEHALLRRKEMEELLAMQRAEAIERERQRRIEAEAERRETLLRMARDLRAANEIRALVAAVKCSQTNSGDTMRIAEWVKWATAVADRTDPICRFAFDGNGNWKLAEPDWPEPDAQ